MIKCIKTMFSVNVAELCVIRVGDVKKGWKKNGVRVLINSSVWGWVSKIRRLILKSPISIQYLFSLCIVSIGLNRESELGCLYITALIEYILFWTANF